MISKTLRPSLTLILTLGGIGLGFLILIFATHSVPTKITDEDKIYIFKILEQAGHAPDILKHPNTFEQEIDLIRLVQAASLNTAPIQKNIPLGQEREPKDLYLSNFAQCSDRARFIHKALHLAGMNVRFIGLYEIIEGHSAFLSLFLARGRSHAVIEAETQKGPLIIDTNAPWISLDPDNNPLAIEDIKAVADNVPKDQITWSSLLSTEPYHLLLQPHMHIYGLYSRNGRLYPPYTPYVPDINWPEFMYNFR